MAIQSKTIQPSRNSQKDHRISTKYLQSCFSLETCELRSMYQDEQEAREKTVHLMIAAEALSVMRVNPL